LDWCSFIDTLRLSLIYTKKVQIFMIPNFCFLCTETWYIHCHFDFHFSMGMVAIFIVEDGSSFISGHLPSSTSNRFTKMWL
jgi:hypothetical protein